VGDLQHYVSLSKALREINDLTCHLSEAQREISDLKHRLRLVRVSLYAVTLSIPVVIFWVNSLVDTRVSEARTACFDEITTCWRAGTNQ